MTVGRIGRLVAGMIGVEDVKKLSTPTAQSNGRKFDRKFDALDNPYDAKKAIQDGDAESLGSYLRYDIPDILNSLARLLATSEREGSDLKLVATEPASSEEQHLVDATEWEETTSQVLECNQAGHLALTAGFLKELADLLARLGRALDSDASSDLKLVFVHRHAGKPVDGIKKMQLRSRVHLHFRMLRLRYPKREAVVQEVADDFDLSRSQVEKILADFKSHQIENK